MDVKWSIGFLVHFASRCHRLASPRLIHHVRCVHLGKEAMFIEVPTLYCVERFENTDRIRLTQRWGKAVIHADDNTGNFYLFLHKYFFYMCELYINTSFHALKTKVPYHHCLMKDWYQTWWNSDCNTTTTSLNNLPLSQTRSLWAHFLLRITLFVYTFMLFRSHASLGLWNFTIDAISWYLR